MTPRRLRTALLCCLLCSFFFLKDSFGQGGTTTATVSGTVVDGSGGVLPGSSVALINLATSDKRVLTSNSEGLFKFAGIAPGTYSLSVEAAGFSKYLQPRLTVDIGQALTVNVTLQVGTTDQTVTVDANSTSVEPGETTLASVVDTAQLQALPSLTRNYRDFVLLTPAVAQNVSSASQGLNVDIAGGRAKEAALLVDGFWNTDESFTYPRQLYSLDAIGQYQVVALAPTAEFGRAIGGIISAVTKTGGSQYHGTGYGYFRNTWMTAEDPLSLAQGLPKPTFSRYLFGGTMGGQAFSTKNHFFSAAERLQQATPQNNNITPAAALVIGLPALDHGNINATLDTTFVLGKFDRTINDRNSVGASFAYTRSRDLSSFTNFATPSRRNRLSSEDYAFQGFYTRIAKGGNWVQDLRGAYFPRTYSLDSPDETGQPLAGGGSLRAAGAPSVNITNVAQFGFGGLSLTMHTQPTQVIYSSTISKGKHDIKFGFDGMFVAFAYDRYTGPQTGTYTFSSLANFQAGIYSLYTESFGQSNLNRFHTYTSYYLQDSWKLTPRLIMNYGLRYDIEWLSEFQGQNYGHDPADVGPRLALSYDLLGTGKTILKFSNGLIYDRIFQNPITPTFFSAEGALLQATAQYAYAAPGAPTYPNTLPNASPNGLPIGTPSVYLTPNNMRVPRSYQLIGTVQQGFGSHFVMNVDGMFNKSWHKEFLFDTNEVYNGTAFVRRNTSYLRIYQYNYGGIAQYSGLAATAKYTTQKVFLGSSFTYARAYDQGDNFSNQSNDLRNPKADYGPAVDTPTVRYTANGSYKLPLHLQLSGIFSIQSGIRYSAFAPPTFSFLGDNNLGDRNPATGRNQFLMPLTTSTDMRLLYSPVLFHRESQHLDLTAEVFNLFNHYNVQTVNTIWGTSLTTPLATFGTPTAYYNTRQLQLGARFEF